MSGKNWEQAMIDLINILEEERKKLNGDLDTILRSIGREVVAGKPASQSSITCAKELESEIKGLRTALEVAVGLKTGLIPITTPEQPSAS